MSVGKYGEIKISVNFFSKNVTDETESANPAESIIVKSSLKSYGPKTISTSVNNHLALFLH